MPHMAKLIEFAAAEVPDNTFDWNQTYGMVRDVRDMTGSQFFSFDVFVLKAVFSIMTVCVGFDLSVIQRNIPGYFRGPCGRQNT